MSRYQSKTLRICSKNTLRKSLTLKVLLAIRALFLKIRFTPNLTHCHKFTHNYSRKRTYRSCARSYSRFS